MKNTFDEPKEYFERNTSVTILILLIGIFFCWISYYLLSNTNPWGTITAIPGIVITMQALWIMMNPYALIYEDRFEIKQSFFYGRDFYFLDAKSVGIQKKNSFDLVYNDGEHVNIPLFGISHADKVKLLYRISEKINESIVTRNV